MTRSTRQNSGYLSISFMVKRCACHASRGPRAPRPGRSVAVFEAIGSVLAPRTTADCLPFRFRWFRSPSPAPPGKADIRRRRILGRGAPRLGDRRHPDLERELSADSNGSKGREQANHAVRHARRGDGQPVVLGHRRPPEGDTSAGDALQRSLLQRVDLDLTVIPIPTTARVVTPPNRRVSRRSRSLSVA